MIDLIKILSQYNTKEFIFYSPLCGDCKVSVGDTQIVLRPYGTTYTDSTYFHFTLDKYGRLDHLNGECILYPSNTCYDWNKWKENMQTKVYYESERFTEIYHSIGDTIDYNFTENENAALAYLKIQELINNGYGGLITADEWKDDKIEKFCIIKSGNGDNKTSFKIYSSFILHGKAYTILAFRSEDLAKEFISYPDNINLINHMLLWN